MHTSINPTEIQRAPLSSFQNIRSSILYGKALQDVKQIERSIAQFGMIMPIIVTKTKGALIVMDGKKRLSALKRMTFAGTLPRSLVTIPYIMADEAHMFGRRTVSVLSSQELFRSILRLKTSGHSVETIAQKLFLCRRSVEELLQLSHLSETVRNAFFRQDISFEQAHAFSAMPCHNAQTSLFLSLGPFAKVSEILDGLEAFQSREENELRPMSVLPLSDVSQNFIWDHAA